MAGSLVTNYLAQGLAASRPATPTTATGTLSLYFASDTEVLSLYDWNDGAWQTVGGAGSAASTTEVLTGTDSSKFVTCDSLAALWEKGSDVASAGTISLGEGGFFHITGTTTITDIDFGTDKSGRKAILVFDGILTLTHNATTLILPTGANIATAAGDCCMVVSEDGSNNVRVVWYQRADGTPLVAATSGMTLIATQTPTGTGVVTFSSIPATYKHLLVLMSGRSTAGSSPGVDVAMTFNNDTGANYDSAQIHLINATIGNASTAAGTSFNMGFVPWSGAPASMAGSGRAEIYNYTDTNLYKRAVVLEGGFGATSVGGTWVSVLGTKQWRATAAISRIDLTLAAGNWDTGSRVSLYGLL